MTAQTLDTMTPGTMPAIAPKKPAVERARFPLVWKIFFLTALLIALVVAVAVGLTITRAQTIARATADKSISSAAQLFKDFEVQRKSRLALTTQLRSARATAYIRELQSQLGPYATTPVVRRFNARATAALAGRS